MNRSAPPAEMIAGRYRVSSRIASGGMGEVIRAVDTVLGRTVAIKLLPTELAARPGFIERFRAEAQAAAQLSHPNVVQIHDWGSTDSTYYMVMEYVRGKNLRDIMSAFGPLPPEQTCRLMIDTLEALEAAHIRGLVHRDIKPENVMITVDGRVKVADFGLARVVERATLTGGLLGTVAYVAPEQARGEQVDGRADIYATGCVMYELLTGSIPFEGDAAQILYQHLNGRVPTPSGERPELPEEIDRIVLRATEREKDSRYATAGEMKEELRSAARNLPAAAPLSELSGEITSEMPAQILETMVPVERRKRHRLRWLLAGLVVIAAAVAGWTFWPVRVPQVIGEDVAAAKSMLAEAGLSAEIRREFSDEPPGTVVSAEPDQGSLVRNGRTVVLKVSRGPALGDLIDLTGMTVEDAQAWIESAGLLVGELVERFDPAEKGTVIGQEPKPGRVRKSTPVNLEVSAGPEIADVPDVVGKPFDEAKTLLEGAGFGTVREDVFNDAPLDTVVDQAPKAGEKAAKGSQIRLVVSKGSEPFAMPNVKDKVCSDAKAQLESLGLVVAVNSKKGATCTTANVLDQDPLAGTMVRKGQEVTLYIP